MYQESIYIGAKIAKSTHENAEYRKRFNCIGHSVQRSWYSNAVEGKTVF